MLSDTVMGNPAINPTNQPGARPVAGQPPQPSHLAFRGAAALGALLVLELQQQVHGGLAVFGLAQEASCVHLPFDGGIPVILHSIVCPAGANEGPLNPEACVPSITSLTSLS